LKELQSLVESRRKYVTDYSKIKSESPADAIDFL